MSNFWQRTKNERTRGESLAKGGFGPSRYHSPISLTLPLSSFGWLRNDFSWRPERASIICHSLQPGIDEGRKSCKHTTTHAIHEYPADFFSNRHARLRCLPNHSSFFFSYLHSIPVFIKPVEGGEREVPNTTGPKCPFYAQSGPEKIAKAEIYCIWVL